MRRYVDDVHSIGSLAGYFPTKIFYLSALYLILVILDVLGLSLLALVFTSDAKIFNISLFNTKILVLHEAVALASLIFIFLLKFICALLVSWVLSKHSLRFLSILRGEVFKFYLGLNKSSGHLKDKLQTILDFTNICGSRLPEAIIRTLGEILILLGVSGFLIYQFGFMFFMVIIVFGCSLIVVAGFFMSRQGSNLGARITEQQNQLIGISAEVLPRLEEVSINGYGSWIFDKFNRASVTHAGLLASERYVSSIPKYFFELLVMLCILVLVGWRSVIGTEEISAVVVELIILAIAGLKILPVVNQLVVAIYLYRAAGPAVAAIGSLIRDGHRYVVDSTYSNPRAFYGTAALTLDATVLELPSGATLDIPEMRFESGDIILISGHSGAGKTSFMKFLLGLMNNIPPLKSENAQIPSEEILMRVSYLSQNGLLFNQSLKENVAVGTEESFDYERYRLACSGASLSKSFIDTWSNQCMGDDGAFISGGERQRVLIARIFYEDKPFWFLDEATSALDLPTENKIFDQIGLRGQKIVFAISHSSNQTHRYTRQLRIEQGKIFEV